MCTCVSQLSISGSVFCSRPTAFNYRPFFYCNPVKEFISEQLQRELKIDKKINQRISAERRADVQALINVLIICSFSTCSFICVSDSRGIKKHGQVYFLRCSLLLKVWVWSFPPKGQNRVSSSRVVHGAERSRGMVALLLKAATRWSH